MADWFKNTLSPRQLVFHRIATINKSNVSQTKRGFGAKRNFLTKLYKYFQSKQISRVELWVSNKTNFEGENAERLLGYNTNREN